MQQSRQQSRQRCKGVMRWPNGGHGHRHVFATRCSMCSQFEFALLYALLYAPNLLCQPQ